MKVLVTGGAGFIGSFFVHECLQNGLHVTGLDKLTYAADTGRMGDVIKKIRLYEADISEGQTAERLIKRTRPDAIVHFAAETHVDRSILFPEDFIKTNVVGTFNLLNASISGKVKKFVHISTDEVYGELTSEKGIKFNEESPLMPNSPYSASKASADTLVRAFSKTYGLQAVTVRPSNNYGPWQYPEKLIPLTMAKALLGEKIPVYGKGANIRTWLYAGDCAQAILKVLEKGKPGEIYNVGSDEEKRNIDVVKSILGMLGLAEELIEFVPDRPGHDFRYALDSSKSRKKLGWKPGHGFEAGLEKTVCWFRDNKGWLFRKKKETDAFVKKLRKTFAAHGAKK